VARAARLRCRGCLRLRPAPACQVPRRPLCANQGPWRRDRGQVEPPWDLFKLLLQIGSACSSGPAVLPVSSSMAGCSGGRGGKIASDGGRQQP
jgi:hypothetical protein